MPLGRSKRFSLPQVRGRDVAKASLGACAALAMLFGASEIREVFPSMDEGGFAQSLRQSAWTEALSGQSGSGSWPWQDVSGSMSLLPSATVRRLGLSAALRDATTDIVVLGQAPRSPQNEGKSTARSTEGDIALGDVGSGTVGIGDRITFTASDGATCVYRVTGRPVVDPHLASGHVERAKGEAGIFDCSPLDGLILQAAQDAQAQKSVPAPLRANSQRNL